MATTTQSTLGAGVYGLSDASYLLGIDERSLGRWSRATPAGKTALVSPSHDWAFSFHDLLSLAVIAVFRQRDVTPDDIRRTVSYLQEEFDTQRPLAHKDIVRALHTAGRSILLAPGIDVSRSGQMAIVETVRKYLRPIEYGADRLARLWKPATNVTLNPEVQAGQPCVMGTRVTTDVIASRVAQGESPKEVAHDMGIATRSATAAVRFESRLRSGEGLALVA